MPRYLVERSFPDELRIPGGLAGIAAVRDVVTANSDGGVTWVHSYVTEDRTKTFCVYDAPSPEAVRKAARRTGLPIDRIIAVRVLDPYFYVSPEG